MRPIVALAGGGIAGLATAIVLQKQGFEVRVYEAAPAIRGGGGGLLLAVNALKALRKMGIEAPVLAAGRPVPVFKVLDEFGHIINDMEDDVLMRTFGMTNLAISRAALHQALMGQTEGIAIEVNKQVAGFQQSFNNVQVEFADGTSVVADYLIGADGLRSAVRQHVLPNSPPRFAGYTCWRAVIQNRDGVEVPFGFEALGRSGRCGMVALADQSVYWFAVVKAEPNDETMKRAGVQDVLARFQHYTEPIPSIIRQTQEHELIWADISDLAPIPHYAFGRVLLIGDAAHATTPNMAQGACQALEDAAVLLDLIEKHGNDLTQVFPRFEQRRLERTHFIVKASRTMGRIAQAQHPALIALRDTVFRLIPQQASLNQLRKIYTVDF